MQFAPVLFKLENETCDMENNREKTNYVVFMLYLQLYCNEKHFLQHL